MKVKSGFKLMKVGVQNLVVAVDERAEEFNGMVRLELKRSRPETIWMP